MPLPVLQSRNHLQRAWAMVLLLSFVLLLLVITVLHFCFPMSRNSTSYILSSFLVVYCGRVIFNGVIPSHWKQLPVSWNILPLVTITLAPSTMSSKIVFVRPHFNYIIMLYIYIDILLYNIWFIFVWIYPHSIDFFIHSLSQSFSDTFSSTKISLVNFTHDSLLVIIKSVCVCFVLL